MPCHAEVPRNIYCPCSTSCSAFLFRFLFRFFSFFSTSHPLAADCSSKDRQGTSRFVLCTPLFVCLCCSPVRGEYTEQY